MRRKNKAKKTRPALGVSGLRLALLVGVAVTALELRGCFFLDSLDRKAFDFRLLARGPTRPGPEVVVVAVDDESLERYGRWPWSRSTVARLLDVLVEDGASVVGFDIVQSEPTRRPDWRPLLESVRPEVRGEVETALRLAPDEDRELVEAVRRSGRAVLGYFFDFGYGNGSDDVPFSEYDVVLGTVDGSGERRVLEATGLRGNLPELTEAARATGYFDIVPDPGDGVCRRVPLVFRHRGRFALPLSLAVLRTHLGGAKAALRFASFGVDSLEIGGTSIPVAEDGTFLVNYRGPGRTFPHFSAARVLGRETAPGTFREKVVLVGVTAKAVMDLRVTPFDEVFPGVEMHATVIDNVLRGDFLRKPRWVSLFVDTLATLALAGSFGFAPAGALGGTLWAGISAASYVLATQWVFLRAGIPLGLAYPLLALGLAYACVTTERFLRESRRRRELRSAFGLYLSPSVVRSIEDRPEKLGLGGERKELTVLFSDIRGFTSLAEGWDPEELISTMNAYFEEMTDVVFAHGGTLDKYMGDAVMAFWGAPLEQSDHARRACATALEMLRRLEALNRAWAEEGKPELECGIGIATGEMIVGNLGSRRRLSYTVVGDSVNLASRLEALNKTYGTRILLSENVVELAGGDFLVREIDRIQVRGKTRATRIFELLGTAGDAAALRTRVDRFERALRFYREGQFPEARELFSALAREEGGGVAAYYEKRCGERLGSPAA